MSHYQFETIHPFRDGNGRLGRLIISLSGLKNGATQLPLPYISRYLEANRAEYYDRLLAVSTRGDWAGWFRFFCTAVADECARNADRVRRLMVLRDQMKAQAAQVRNSTALLGLIEQLFISPAVNVHRARETLGVSQPTAQAYINALVGAGFLREFTGRSYGRVWVCDPLIAIMSEP